MSTLNVIRTTEVHDYVLQLADRLQLNYNSRYGDSTAVNDTHFEVDAGRKYYRIWMIDNQKSIHAFINKETGDVFKPASYNKPAKHVRYNLLDKSSRDNCLLRADWAGGYLYLR